MNDILQDFSDSVQADVEVLKKAVTGEMEAIAKAEQAILDHLSKFREKWEMQGIGFAGRMSQRTKEFFEGPPKLPRSKDDELGEEIARKRDAHIKALAAAGLQALGQDPDKPMRPRSMASSG